MTPRSLLNLGILVAVIILAAIAFYPRQQPEPETAMVTLLTISKADVETISIQGAGKPQWDFDKQDEHWFMNAPVRVRANEHRISTLLNILRQPADHKLAVAPNSLSKYGLDAPLFSIRFNGTAVSVGGSDPIHQRRYVMARDSVYLVDDSFSRWLGEGAGAFIDAALLPPDSTIQKIQLPNFEVVKSEAQWQYKPEQESETANAAHYSPDSLQTFIDEWRYGRALQVSVLSAPYDPSKGRPLKVFLQNQAEPVVFYEESSAEDTALVRADLNIRYHVTKDTLGRLTKVTEQNDIEPSPEEEPANAPPSNSAT